MEDVKTYYDLMDMHGCAACIHRRYGACYHPIIAQRARAGQFNHNVFEYVKNSCWINMEQPKRPKWCPYLSQQWKLTSEKLITISHRERK